MCNEHFLFEIPIFHGLGGKSVYYTRTIILAKESSGRIHGGEVFPATLKRDNSVLVL